MAIKTVHPAHRVSNVGTLSINMKQMDRWRVTQDNVREYDAIMKSAGKVSTLDHRAYQHWLLSFNIFYTFTPE